MNFALKAGLASAALVAAACTTSTAFAGGLHDRSEGSLKDAPGYAPTAQVVAGPCYVRGDIGYSVARTPTAKWPVNNITRTWSRDPTADNVNSHADAGYTGGLVSTTYDYQGDEITNAKIENTWLGEVGVGCGSGSRGFRGEVVMGFRGRQKFDGEPRDFQVIDVYPADPRQTTPVVDDPIHTVLKSYTLMVNGYYDLGNFHGFVPYVGAGIGVAYHQMNDVYFTNNAFLTNRIEGNNDIALAWSLMAGVGYQISNRAVLDLGYRYINLGTATSGRVDNAGFANPRVTINDLAAHEFKVGLRYHFGSMGNCCTEVASYK